jgi:hypothetical protein
MQNNTDWQSYWHFLWIAILVSINSLWNLVKYLLEIHQLAGIVSQKKSINGRVPLASVTHQGIHIMSRCHALAMISRKLAKATNVE